MLPDRMLPVLSTQEMCAPFLDSLVLDWEIKRILMFMIKYPFTLVTNNVAGAGIILFKPCPVKWRKTETPESSDQMFYYSIIDFITFIIIRHTNI